MDDRQNKSDRRKQTWKMLQAMVGIGMMSALMISMTFEGTMSRIKSNRAKALEKAIFQVVPGIESKKAFVLDASNKLVPAEGEASGEGVIYAGYNSENQLKGIAIEASGIGFADVIKILYGYDIEREVIVGFHVLESKETPGLGDKIEKDDEFLANFDQLDVALNDVGSALKNQIVPVKKGKKVNAWEVDGITGATISSKAIGNILGASTAEWIPVIYGQQAVFNISETVNESE